MIKNNLSLFILFLALSQIIFSNDEELKKLRNDGEGCLNIAFKNKCVERGMSKVDKIYVLVDNDHIGKFVLLDTKDE